jgi:hypothetical protein
MTSSAFTARRATSHDLSPVLTPGRNRKRSNSARLDCSTKKTPPSNGSQYGDTPSKYVLMRWVYNPTHYGMGLTTTTLTFGAIPANEGHNSKVRGRGCRHHKQRGDRRPRMAPNSCMVPLGD